MKLFGPVISSFLIEILCAPPPSLSTKNVWVRSYNLHYDFLFQDKRFDKMLDAMSLQKRGTGGVDTAAVGGTFDISNADRLGKSEVKIRPVVIDTSAR